MGPSRKFISNLSALRATIERGYAPDTALPGSHGVGLSSGQCAATAYIVNNILGGDFVSTQIGGESHWFNRLSVDDDVLDIDITGDQFGFPKIQVKPAGSLYPNARVRAPSDVNAETKRRAIILANRAQIKLK